MEYHLWMLLLGMEYILLDRALSNSISRATRTPEKFIITEGIYLSYQRTTNLSRHHPPKAVFSTAHRHLNYKTNKRLQILPKESVSVTADIKSHVGVLLKRTTVSADWSTPHRYDRTGQLCHIPSFIISESIIDQLSDKIWLPRWKHCMVEIPSWWHTLSGRAHGCQSKTKAASMPNHLKVKCKYTLHLQWICVQQKENYCLILNINYS